MTQIVVGISDIVRLHFGYDLEEDSFSYNRFMTHLQYLAQRIVSGVSGGKNDAFLYEQVKINYPEPPHFSTYVGSVLHEILLSLQPAHG